jgi:transposase
MLLAPLLPEAKPGGRPRATELRAVGNALSSWLRSGEAWRLVPPDVPPWQTV